MKWDDGGSVPIVIPPRFGRLWNAWLHFQLMLLSSPPPEDFFFFFSHTSLVVFDDSDKGNFWYPEPGSTVQGWLQPITTRIS